DREERAVLIDEEVELTGAAIDVEAQAIGAAIEVGEALGAVGEAGAEDRAADGQALGAAQGLAIVRRERGVGIEEVGGGVGVEDLQGELRAGGGAAQLEGPGHERGPQLEV